MTFKQFVTELAREDVTIPPVEIEEMTKRFGNKVLQMGHLREDDSMLVPVDCIIEAIRSLESHTITEAAESINNNKWFPCLNPAKYWWRRWPKPEKKIEAALKQRWILHSRFLDRQSRSRSPLLSWSCQWFAGAP